MGGTDVFVGFCVGVFIDVGLFCVGGLVGGTVVLAGGFGFLPGALSVLIALGVASSVLANTCEGPKTVTINAVTTMPVITHKGLLFTFLPSGIFINDALSHSILA